MAAELFRITPSKPASLPTSLKPEQLALLQEIASPFVKTGSWPVWYYVTNVMDRRGFDAREVLSSLPRVGSSGTTGSSYGFTTRHDFRMLGEADKVRLTVAAALPLEELRSLIAEPFLRALHHMIKIQRDVVPSPTEVTQTWLDSEELAAAIPSLSPQFIAWLPDIMSTEPVAWGGSSSGPNPPADPSWRKEIRREVLKYANAKDVHSYVATVCALTAESAKGERWAYEQSVPLVPEQSPMPQGLPTDTYVKEELIEELAQLDDATLSTVKLVELLQELNFCYLHKKPLAFSSLLRAVIDHVPPGFGASTFAGVISSGPWGRTDKKYLDRLQEFRNQADDVLHRQMGRRRNRIDMDDVPAATALNALLDGLVVALRDRTTQHRGDVV